MIKGELRIKEYTNDRGSYSMCFYENKFYFVHVKENYNGLFQSRKSKKDGRSYTLYKGEFEIVNDNNILIGYDK